MPAIYTIWLSPIRLLNEGGGGNEQETIQGSSVTPINTVLIGLSLPLLKIFATTLFNGNYNIIYLSNCISID